MIFTLVHNHVSLDMLYGIFIIIYYFPHMFIDRYNCLTVEIIILMYHYSDRLII